MAALSLSEPGMGQQPVYLLHGWKGNEDEDVDIESSEGSSHGEVGDSRRLSGVKVPSLGGVNLNKIVESTATSVKEAGGQECESALVDARACATGHEAADPHQVEDVSKRGVAEGSSEGVRSMSLCEPVTLKKSAEGRRLDARKFRNIFAAKLSGSKGFNIGDGKVHGEAKHALSPQALSNSSHELSGATSSVIDKQRRQKASLDGTELDAVGVDSILRDEEHKSLGIETHVQDVEDKSSKVSVVNDKCKVFSRKRKHVLLQGHKVIEQDANVVQLAEMVSKVNNSSNTPAKAPEQIEKEESLSGRSKRVRRDNKQKDYIPWSDFGRPSLKKSGWSIAEASNNNILHSSGKGVLSQARNLSQADEVWQEKSLGTQGGIEDLEAPLEGEVVGLKVGNSSQIMNTKQVASSTSSSLLGPREVKVKTEGRAEFVQNSSQGKPSKVLQGAGDCHEELSAEKAHESGRLQSGDRSCELVVLIDSALIHGSEVSQQSSGTNGGCSSKEKESEAAMCNVSLVNSDREASLENIGNRTVSAENTQKDGKSHQLVKDTEYLERTCGMDGHDSICKKCQKEGNLICCDGKGCTVTYHIACLDPPLKEVPLGDWYCPDCANKRIFCGMHSVSKGIESIWDVKETMLEDHSSVPERKLNKAMSKVAEKLEANKCQDAINSVIEANNGSRQESVNAAGGKDAATLQPKGTSVAPCARKMYFVKYKGVAHVHNTWLQESQILKEAPKLLHNFKKKLQQGKAGKWDLEWAKACRVIGKRVTMLSRGPGAVSAGEGRYESGRCLEWFIKWKNLGYDSCTWEPADRGVLASEQAKELIKDYEHRSAKARERGQQPMVEHSNSCASSVLNVHAPWKEGGHLHSDLQNAIEKLCKRWQSNSSSILISEAHQERIGTIVGFLWCLVEKFEVVKPILVVVPPLLLRVWEATFQEYAPSINMVVYSGSKEARQVIQRYEFYNADRNFMAQIILTSYDILNMDVECLRSLTLDALVIDECHRLKGSKTSKSLHLLDSSFRLLLISESIKETADDYQQLLSVLLSGSESIDTSALEDSDLTRLKANMRKHIVYESKQDAIEKTIPKEYWIPVSLTAFQVEEYCKLLIDKSDILTRSSKRDKVSTPHDLLLKIRECCNHPFLVNPSLQGSLTHLSPKELLEFGIQASGKLMFLDSLLQTAKSSGKRIVVITQIHLRSEKASQMEILDDYMRQRFGVNSYERVDAGLALNKKIRAVQRFNAKDTECFVFLLEKRACGPAIKLSSVNCVVIFNSDWNPQNDIQAVLKVRLNTQHEESVVCRLYSPHTIEERLLIGARKGVELDNNCQNFTLALCQKLLRWGAQKNFEILGQKGQARTNEDKTIFDETARSLLEGRPYLPAENDPQKRLYWESAFCPRQVGTYSKGFQLHGETDEELALEEMVPSSEFWTEILRDRQLESQDAQGRELRARKKVRYYEGPFSSDNQVQGSAAEDDELRRKKRRVTDDPGLSATFLNHVGSLVDQDSPDNPQKEPTVSTVVDGVNGNQKFNFNRSTETIPTSSARDIPSLGQLRNSCDAAGSKMSKEQKISMDFTGAEGTTETMTGLRTEQQQLLLGVKADLDRLCQALKFQPDTNAHVEQLLFSIGSCFKLPKEKSLLHSIELSLCWMAAEHQHYSIDRNATRVLAEACFGVHLDKIDTVYAKLEERWKKKFALNVQEASGPQEQETSLLQRVEPKSSSKVQLDNSQREREQSQTSSSILEHQHASTDPKLLSGAHTSSKLLPQAPMQIPAETVVLEKHDLPVVDGTGAFRHSEENNVIEGRPQTSHLAASHMPDIAVSAEADREVCTATEQNPMAKETLALLKRERMQSLLNAQKMQIRKLETFERSYKDKVKQLYEKACLKLRPSATGSSEALAEERTAYLFTLSMLDTSFKSIRDNIAKRQSEEREKENKLVALHKEGSTSLQTHTPCSEINEIQNLLPSNLKAAIETGELVSFMRRMSSSSFSQGASLIADVSAAAGSTGILSPTRPGCLEVRGNLGRTSVQGTSSISSQVQQGNSLYQQQQKRQHHPQHLSQEQLQRWLPPFSREQAPIQQVGTLGAQQTGELPFPEVNQSQLSSQSQAQTQSQLQLQQQVQLAQTQQTQVVCTTSECQQQSDGLPISLGIVSDQFSAAGQHLTSVSGVRPVSPNVTRSISQSMTHAGGTSIAPQASDSSGTSSTIGARASIVATTANATSLAALPTPPTRLSQAQTNDPLVQELLRLRKEQDKLKSIHEGEKDKLKAQFMKELEALSRKYETLLQEEDSTYTRKAAAIDLNLKKVEMNRRLAEVFRLKNSHESSSASAGLNAAYGQELRTHGSVGQHMYASVSARNLMRQGPNLSDSCRSITTVGLTSSIAAERPDVHASVPGNSGMIFVPLAGTQTGVGLPYSQGQACFGLSSQSSHASPSVGPRSSFHTSAESSLFDNYSPVPSRAQVDITGATLNTGNNLPSCMVHPQSLQTNLVSTDCCSSLGISSHLIGGSVDRTSGCLHSSTNAPHSITTLAPIPGNIAAESVVTMGNGTSSPSVSIPIPNFAVGVENVSAILPSDNSASLMPRQVNITSEQADDDRYRNTVVPPLPQSIDEHVQIASSNLGVGPPPYDERGATDVIYLSDDD